MFVKMQPVSGRDILSSTPSQKFNYETNDIPPFNVTSIYIMY